MKAVVLHEYPSLQFCWLRLLPDLLYIPKWRGSKETLYSRVNWERLT
jgi:hypothetical protein